MDKNPVRTGVPTETFAGIAPVTPEKVHSRARELALIAGHVSQADYEQAKRELTGGALH